MPSQNSQSSTERPYDYSIHYRNWHSESDQYVDRVVKWQRECLAEFLPADKNARILDIGCGMGFAVLAAVAEGYRNATGIDLDPQQIAACRRLGVAAELVHDTAQYLADRRDAYELVFMFDILEHVPVAEQIDILRRVHDSLSEGGRLLLQVPNANSPLAARWRYIDYTHTSSFTEYSLDFVLRNAGFQTVTILADDRLRRPSLRLWRRKGRKSFFNAIRKWLVRKCWVQVLRAELAECGDDVATIPLELNLRAVAHK